MKKAAGEKKKFKCFMLRQLGQDPSMPAKKLRKDTGKLEFLKCDGSLVAVGSAPGVKIDHCRGNLLGGRMIIDLRCNRVRPVSAGSRRPRGRG